MNILVAYAVDPEFEPWRKLRKFSEIPSDAFTIRRTEVDTATVDFIVTGMGSAHAARAMQAVPLTGYALGVAAGFAGSLHARLDVSDIVVAKSVLRAATSDSLDSDASFAAEAIAAGAKPIDALVSSDHVATTAAEKTALGATAQAVDMESYTVLDAAKRRGMSIVALRAISDRHDQTLPLDLSSVVDERGQVSIGRVLKMAAGSPGQLSALMKLGRESKAAAEVLARFLEAYIQKISRIRTQESSGAVQEETRRAL